MRRHTSFLTVATPSIPAHTGFGWLHDPLLTEMQVLLDAVANKTGEAIPWTAAVPGAATNWTSIEETRRRKNPDTNKTGKKNPNQVSDAGGVLWGQCVGCTGVPVRSRYDSWAVW